MRYWVRDECRRYDFRTLLCAVRFKKGRYAVFTHHGGLQTLSQTINYIWGTWILSTKEVLASRDSFELYDERFHGYADADTEIDIYVAIQ